MPMSVLLGRDLPQLMCMLQRTGLLGAMPVNAEVQQQLCKKTITGRSRGIMGQHPQSCLGTRIRGHT